MVKVIWRKRALTHLQKNYKYILKESPQSAKKVKNIILDTADSLKYNPEIYP